MKFQTIMQLIGEWGGLLSYFPSDADARIGIAKKMVKMANNEAEIRWLIDRLPDLYKDWPAFHEVRAVFCSKFKPRDGIEVYSEIYKDGIPAESKSAPQLEGAALKKLEAGPIANPEMKSLVVSMAPAKNLNAVRGLPIKPGVILSGETEDGALERTLAEEREKLEQASRPFPASPAMIADVKRRQLEAAQSPETKAILTEEARAAKRRALDELALMEAKCVDV